MCVNPDGWVQYTGYNGTAVITGRSVSVVLAGAKIRLVATGTGRFVLKGRGVYKTGHLTGNWWQDDHEMEIQ